MRDEIAASVETGLDVAPSATRLGHVADVVRVRTVHGSYLCLSAEGTQLVHAFRPDPEDAVTLFRSPQAEDFGLLHATRAFTIQAGGRTARLHLVRLIHGPGADRFLIGDPVGGDCLLAYQDWHLNMGGPTSLGADRTSADAHFSSEFVRMPAIADEQTASAMLGLMTMLDRGSLADAGHGDIASPGDMPDPVLSSLLETLRTARRIPGTDHARSNVPVGTHPEPACAVQDSFLSIGPFERTLDHDPARSDILPWLDGGWHCAATPNFSGASTTRDRTIRVSATGRRATISFALPYRPVQARLRLTLSEIAYPAIMTVSLDGWELGRNAIGKWGRARSRLDYIIRGEAIQSDRLTIQISFDRPPQALRSGRRLFQLSGCQLDLGPDSPPVVVPDDPAELLNQFESLGWNCEFGFLQRHFGLDRLGVLTFAGVSHLPNLLDLLDQGFAGLGDAGSLEANEMVFSVRAKNMPPRNVREFWITNKRYRLAMHSFKGPDHHSREESIRENEMKLKYLSRKFIEDLEDGAKILVYTDVDKTDPNDMLSLHASLNRYGPNKLFWVTHPIAGRQAGCVEWIAPNLLRGYSFNPHADVQWFNADHWLLLCRRAYAAFMRAGRANAEPVRSSA